MKKFSFRDMTLKELNKGMIYASRQITVAKSGKYITVYMFRNSQNFEHLYQAKEFIQNALKNNF